MRSIKRTLVVVLLVMALLGGVASQTSAALPSSSLGNLEALPLFETLVRVIRTARTYYVEDVSLETLLRGAVRGAVSTLDRYSTYFTKQDFEDFLDDALEGAFSGIGITFEIIDGYPTVVSPMEGSPASRAGLKPRDRITEVDGKSTHGWSSDTASRSIRGKEGTSVRLKIQRHDADPIEVTVERALITQEVVSVRVADEGKVGIIKLSQFTYDSAFDFVSAYDAFYERGVKGLVIDLRDNPGGSLSATMNMLTRLIPKGAAIQVVDRTGKRTEIKSGSDLERLPLVVLINGGSASASEIMAGAIKDYGTGYLMGQKTFGKGSIQTLLDLPNDEGMKLTTHHYLTPLGKEIDGIGVAPDLVIAETWPDVSRAKPLVNTGVMLKRGDKGEHVLSLSHALLALGHLKKPTDSYGADVITAVAKFQLEVRLLATGEADNRTLAELNAALLMNGLGGADFPTFEAIRILKERVGF